MITTTVVDNHIYISADKAKSLRGQLKALREAAVKAIGEMYYGRTIVHVDGYGAIIACKASTELQLEAFDGKHTRPRKIKRDQIVHAPDNEDLLPYLTEALHRERECRLANALPMTTDAMRGQAACYWDAATRGNHVGDSYVLIGGERL